MFTAPGCDKVTHMKFLHTSDWHLGRRLYGRKRYREFTAFLDWLAERIRQEKIDCLLVAGDVFDTATPGNRAQELYYRFLNRAAGSCCRHIVVIGGNHDSPTFLNAPRALLRALNVHVLGAMTKNPEDEVLVLQDSQNQPEAIICAVPYLRDRDIRLSRAGESAEEKNRQLAEGILAHYHQVCSLAEKERAENDIPIIGMGHLFIAGSTTVEDDGVRELYVGSLGVIGRDVFPACLDYVALGHLHIPQKVAGEETLRYSGSPIPMGFGEARQQKMVVEIECAGQKPHVRKIEIPCFQPLKKINGSLEEIQSAIAQEIREKSTAWLEIDYTGGPIVGNLQELIDEMIAGSGLEVCRIRNRRLVEKVMKAASCNETLDDLDVRDVFRRCLESYEITGEERMELMRAHDEILTLLQEEDSNAQ